MSYAAKMERIPSVIVPTEKQFRDAGYTADAVNYPLSEAAVARLCAFNGITPDLAPLAWRYAPNAIVRDYWENKA